MKRVHGYTDLGRVRVPPLPRRIILTDRADGTLWQLSHGLIDGNDHVSIVSDPSLRKADFELYPAYNEPFVGNHPKIRFILRGGRIGYEYLDNTGVAKTAASQGRIMSRDGYAKRFMEIIVPTTWQRSGDTLAYEVVTID